MKKEKSDTFSLLQKYKEIIEKKRRELDKALGAKESLMSRLKEEFGMANISLAKEKLRKLEDKRDDLLDDLDEYLEKLRKSYDFRD